MDPRKKSTEFNFRSFNEKQLNISNTQNLDYESEGDDSTAYYSQSNDWENGNQQGRKHHAESFIGSNLEALEENDKKNKKININLDTYKFSESTLWIDNSECYICSQKFTRVKLQLKHHCRSCGQSVCSQCSNNSINKKRVCDKCLYFAHNSDLKDRLENYNVQMAQRIQRMAYLKQKCEQRIDDTEILINMYLNHMREFSTEMENLIMEKENDIKIAQQKIEELEQQRLEKESLIGKYDEDAQKYETIVEEQKKKIDKQRLEVTKIRGQLIEKKKEFENSINKFKNINLKNASYSILQMKAQFDKQIESIKDKENSIQTNSAELNFKK